MKKKLLITGLTLSVMSSAHADLLGVQDTVLIANSLRQLEALYKQLQTASQTYTTVKQQYDTTQHMLTNAKAQLDKANELINKNSGHYGFGDLQNTLEDLHGQQWSPDNWSQALAGEVGNNASKYRKLLDSYQKNNTIAKSKEFEKGAQGNVVKNYQQSAAVNQAASVQSEYAFNEVNNSLKRIHDLSQKIEQADNTKASVDLNSRLLTEVAYLQTQNLKAQSLVNQQLAQKQAVELSERGDNSKLLAFDDDY
ncbi:TPA: type IV secretion system protein [Legionella pneumophila]|nr:hypothetical protein [Legionella pneumophila]